MKKINRYLTMCGSVYCFEVGKKSKKIGWFKAFLIALALVVLLGLILGDTLPSMVVDFFLWP